MVVWASGACTASSAQCLDCCVRRALTLPTRGCALPAGGPGTWVTRTYAASRNGGATMNGKPISVSRTHEVERSLMVCALGPLFLGLTCVGVRACVMVVVGI